MTGTVYGSQSCHVREGTNPASSANLCLLLICTGWWLTQNDYVTTKQVVAKGVSPPNSQLANVHAHTNTHTNTHLQLQLCLLRKFQQMSEPGFMLVCVSSTLKYRLFDLTDLCPGRRRCKNHLFGTSTHMAYFVMLLVRWWLWGWWWLREPTGQCSLWAKVRQRFQLLITYIHTDLTRNWTLVTLSNNSLS